MLEPIREYFIHNGEALKIETFNHSLFKDRNTVYEVIRLMSGKAVFLKEHIHRMMDSLKKSGIDNVADPASVPIYINKLIDANPPGDGNILFCITKADWHSHLMAWFVEHHYPSEMDYQNGVKIRSLKAMRSNPTAKVWNAQLRKKASYLKESAKVFEILYVDNNKNITECSKSNIFLIRGDRIFTPPANAVLPGITREKIFMLCRQHGISILETDIRYHDLTLYESAFITGTSPKILAVKHIDNIRFNPANAILRALMQAYDELIAEELK